MLLYAVVSFASCLEHLAISKILLLLCQDLYCDCRAQTSRTRSFAYFLPGGALVGLVARFCFSESKSCCPVFCGQAVHPYPVVSVSTSYSSIQQVSFWVYLRLFQVASSSFSSELRVLKLPSILKAKKTGLPAHTTSRRMTCAPSLAHPSVFYLASSDCPDALSRCCGTRSILESAHDVIFQRFKTHSTHTLTCSCPTRW